MSLSVVTNEDNMVMMARYPDKFFDLAIVDPPYGLGEHGGKKREGGQSKMKGLRSRNYENKGWDARPPDKDYFEELFRVSKHQIIWGGNYFIDHLTPTPCFIVWDKKGTDKSDFADCELAWTSFSSSVRKFKYDWIGFGYLNNSRGEVKIHPTQKPTALYEWILRNYAKPVDKILDTHMGSQSSRIAAHDLGFDYWGCENDPGYFAEGCKRYQKHIQQLTIF
ncbi:site-specific DNA-methyltransferase (adenine-specific) [Dyadobacter sp. SG02]|uniref:DNA methyltransferase n=1 Tax=Dyadobacter sp. SG02 TaxID=1855291 RepID=UPI0008BB4CEE|nr:DNA methyltransferase [Dyadobacter sp. SG02]SEI39667.1 site-specific DNA-methyltransferase (adenine-specific) [Dyadobacter sp. SG02]